MLFLSPPLLTVINKYLDNVEKVRTTEDRTRQIIENLGFINETECPTLEFVDVPKVNKYILGILGYR